MVIGIPLGIAAGRLVWHSIADNFPIDYVAPLAIVALLVAVPVVLAVANALAAGPAWAASRIRPAEVLAPNDRSPLDTRCRLGQYSSIPLTN